MRLILIHGSLQDLVSKKVSEIKTGFDPLAISEDVDAASQSLFAQKRLLILNNPDLKIAEKVLTNDDPELTVIFRFSKSLEKSSLILKKLSGVKVEIFAYTETNQENIFPLLDMVGNKNKRAFLDFEQNYEMYTGQYVLTMLGYFLRRMITGSKSDFMNQKINQQKKNFPPEKIEQAYKDLLETDFKIKQGMIEEKMGVTMLIQRFLN